MLQYYLFSKQCVNVTEGRAVLDRTDGVDVHCENISQLFGLGGRRSERRT